MRLFVHTPPDRRAARLLMRRGASEPASIDRTPPAPTLSSGGIDALSRVLREHAPHALTGVTPDECAAAELRAAARLLAADARAAHPGCAERLVIELKVVWRTLPEVRRLPAGGEREEVWYRLVRLCIEEFYVAAGRRPMPGPGASAVA